MSDPPAPMVDNARKCTDPTALRRLCAAWERLLTEMRRRRLLYGEVIVTGKVSELEH